MLASGVTTRYIRGNPGATAPPRLPATSNAHALHRQARPFVRRPRPGPALAPLVAGDDALPLVRLRGGVVGLGAGLHGPAALQPGAQIGRRRAAAAPRRRRPPPRGPGRPEGAPVDRPGGRGDPGDRPGPAQR